MHVMLTNPFRVAAFRRAFYTFLFEQLTLGSAFLTTTTTTTTQKKHANLFNLMKEKKEREKEERERERERENERKRQGQR